MTPTRFRATGMNPRFTVKGRRCPISYRFRVRYHNKRSERGRGERREQLLDATTDIKALRQSYCEVSVVYVVLYVDLKLVER